MAGFTRERLARKSDVSTAEATLEVPVVIDPDDLPAAYTQTYSTAARVVPAATAVAVTLADGVGTNDGTAAAITDVATAKAAIQELNVAITALIADNLAQSKVINALIDDHQALGLCDS